MPPKPSPPPAKPAPTFNFPAQIAQIRSLPPPQFSQLLQTRGVYKLRSQETHVRDHAPVLATTPSAPPQTNPIHILLLGDSMLERIKTTGSHTVLGGSGGTIPFPQVFNAGVGGDKVKNVIYRLGTMELYKGVQRHGVQRVVLQMGTNDLKSKGGLPQPVFAEYLLVLEAMRRLMNNPQQQPKVLVTGLLPRRDIQQSLIDEANRRLERLVQEVNNAAGNVKVFYMPPPNNIDTSFLVDHVHLNEAGYTIFVTEIMRRLHLIDSQSS